MCQFRSSRGSVGCAPHHHRERQPDVTDTPGPAEEWQGSVLALQRRRRIPPRVAVAVAAVLTVEAAVIVAATGQAVAVPAAEREAAAEAGPEPVRKAGPRQAEDIPSARVAARLAGHRVEALSERGETSTTWANKDGSPTTELAVGPVRFERDGEVGRRRCGAGRAAGRRCRARRASEWLETVRWRGPSGGVAAGRAAVRGGRPGHARSGRRAAHPCAGRAVCPSRG